MKQQFCKNVLLYIDIFDLLFYPNLINQVFGGIQILLVTYSDPPEQMSSHGHFVEMRQDKRLSCTLNHVRVLKPFICADPEQFSLQFFTVVLNLVFAWKYGFLTAIFEQLYYHIIYIPHSSPSYHRWLFISCIRRVAQPSPQAKKKPRAHQQPHAPIRGNYSSTF